MKSKMENQSSMKISIYTGPKMIRLFLFYKKGIENTVQQLSPVISTDETPILIGFRMVFCPIKFVARRMN